MDSEGELIRKSLEVHHHDKWGFVVYRCTYGNDEGWARFLEIINTNTRRSLEFTGDEDLMPRLDWVIQEVPEGTSKDDVRRRFREWVAASGVRSGLTSRYSYCLHVDAESLESILNGPQPPARDIRGKTWVNIVDIQWALPDPATFDWEGAGKDPVTDDAADEGEREVDVCRMYDVGWMKVSVGSLAPRAYAILENIGWEGCYARPPKIVKL